MKGFLYFYGDWCQPCKILSPAMDDLKKNGMPIEKINVDYDVSMVKQYNVTSVPTVILLENGVEKTRFVGAKPQSEIVRIFNS